MGGGYYNDTPDIVEVKSQSTVPMRGTFHTPQKVKTFWGPRDSCVSILSNRELRNLKLFPTDVKLKRI